MNSAKSDPISKDLSVATVAGGCFWCTEAVFKKLKGVEKVTPGYTGGETKNPNYKNIADHAEAIQIEFDPKIISYETLLEVFFATHDPTTLNRQGNDVGTQYRSEIFYHNDSQKALAQEAIDKFQNNYNDKIVTKISEAGDFYEAEDYHQDYYAKNRDAGYCRIVIDPKINKLMKSFSDKVK